MADRSENAVASLNRLHSELNKVVVDYKRQLATMDDDAREKGRQHDLQVAEYKRKIDLANNTVDDELAEKMLLMHEEQASELRSMREQANVTMNDVIRSSASMDAEHKEDTTNASAFCTMVSQRTRGR